MAQRHWGAAALVFAGAASHSAHAQSTTIATWVEFAPGSTPAALAAGSWGDAPTSLTNTILVRAVVTNATSCPAASLDHGAALTLKQRFIGSQLTNTPGSAGATNGKTGYPQYFVSPTATAPANFATGTPMATTSWGECEAVVPPGHAIVTVDGVDMKLPVAHPKRILIMADTGCRLNGAKSAAGANQQNCASPAAFPWSYLASYEATFKPDVILQVGDWFYRDTNCLTNGTETYPGCNTPSSPNYETWGDTFDSWNADVFFPAKTLLAAAPWIMARGNHESCGRGARGWYAMLDPFPLNTANSYAAGIECPLTTAYPAPGASTATYTGDFEPSYVVPVGGVNILVHDSSFANDSKVDTAMAANYDIDLSNLLSAVSAASAKPQIFATHKPTFGLSYGTAPTGCATGTNGTSDASGDWTEQGVFNGGTGYTASAFKNGVPASIGLFVSGHVHQFQYFNFGSPGSLNQNFAPQLIVGTGGSLLDADCNTGVVPSGIADPAKFTQPNFPYVVQQYPGTSSTGTTSNTFSHDEFGFAVLNAVTDGNGNTTGYNADIYKISSARAGICKIVLNPRSITCHL
jgi:hypothetical protein